MLYDIRFTTQKLVKTLDKRGKVIAETALATPIAMTALPYQAAMSYSGCDNFEIAQHVSDYPSKFGSGRDDKVGNGTKSRGLYRAEPKTKTKTSPSAAHIRNDAQKAAATGDLSAAINA